MRHIILIAHNIRSCHNVGSLLRTADGLGIERVLLTGYTPYPLLEHDDRLPHLVHKIATQIHKTALGAEHTVAWAHYVDIEAVFRELKDNGYEIVALEQAPHAMPLPDFVPGKRIALVVGREVEGIEAAILTACDKTIEIPMFGQKESFNVAAAAAMALYHMRFQPER
jgi:23S rRNA (guanosine2251-2'-O)-methyltransferase